MWQTWRLSVVKEVGEPMDVDDQWPERGGGYEKYERGTYRQRGRTGTPNTSRDE